MVLSTSAQINLTSPYLADVSIDMARLGGPTSPLSRPPLPRLHAIVGMHPDLEHFGIALLGEIAI
jgi:hypothetical protein